MTKTLGELLTEVGRTSGLERLAALAACADTVIEALHRARRESGVNQFDLDELAETQRHVLVQALFFGQRIWECEEGLKKWCRFITQHPQVLEIPGLATDLEDFLKRAVEARPDLMRQVALRLRPRHCPEDTLSVFWLGDDLGPAAVPPGHNLWRALGVSDKGQWQNLTESDRCTRILRSYRRNRLSLARILLRLLCNSAEKGTSRSIGDERTVPLQAPPDDSRWRGYQGYHLSRTTGEGYIEPVDENADRLVRSLEDRDEARTNLDRLVAAADLTPGERTVFEGIRAGKEGGELRLHAQNAGVSASSLPVLTTRLRKRLREATKSSSM